MIKKQAPSAPHSSLSPLSCEVAVPVALDQTFSYASDTPLQPGTIVDAPFRNKSVMGIVWPSSLLPSTNEISDKSYKLKSIEQVYDLPMVPQSYMAFIDWVSRYTLAPLGNVLKLGLSIHFTPKQLATPLPAQPKINIHPIHLSPVQENAWSTLEQYVSDKSNKPTLLQGVTGAGKTEVYFKAIEKSLQSGGTCLILQPEINLTHEWIKRFEKHFGFKPSLWHSHLTPKKRRDTWRQVLEGQTKVLVGARSALFLPYKKLNLLIVDEEHDSSYKQEEQTLYHARDMAVVRANFEKCPCLLVSATPSLETQANVECGKYHAVYITERFGKGGLPTIDLIDMRDAATDLRKLAHQHKRTFYLSPSVQQAIKETLEKKQQVLLFLNRRGYAPLTLCRTCGHRIQCPNCTAWLVDHRTSYRQKLSCHHCGFSKPYPKDCPECHAEDALAPCGPGVERIDEEVQFLFPNARTQVMTSETLSSPKEAQKLLQDITQGDIDIIIGTQVMAKGHTFPNLTLTVVIDADLGLSTTDLRAGEKTFQLLHQVGGRAGRAAEAGRVLLQTFDPDNPVMTALRNYDDTSFYALEQQKRKSAALPPYGQMAALTVTSSNESDAKAICLTLAKTCPPHEAGLEILGPAPAVMAKRKRQFRWRFLIKAPKKHNLQNFIRQWVHPIKLPHSSKLIVDIDPQTFV